MGNPFFLIDELIRTGQFSAWVDAHEEQKNEKTMWEMYLHKLGAYDDRSFSEFKSDIHANLTKLTRPSDEELSATVGTSYEILKNFDISEERG